MRIAPLARAIGVTRLGDITGLDRIGIPLFQAVRPLARSLSVSQGKGATPDAARVSALMEAIEVDHAERITPDHHGAASPDEASVWAHVARAEKQAEDFDPGRPRGWIDADDLVSGRRLRIPFGLISMDFTAPIGPDTWPNTNGLASGNHLIEAQVSALCEVIERDAHARWLARTPARRGATAIARHSIDSRLARALLARVARAQLDVTLWDMTGPHGIATIGCALIERGAGSAMLLPPAFGSGSHPDAEVALSRAITEAAQTRGTMLAGAREDIGFASYEDPPGRRFGMAWAHHDFEEDGARPWSRVPSTRNAQIQADRDLLVARIAATGAPAIACADLTRDDCGIAVVKMLVPGFGDHNRPSNVP